MINILLRAILFDSHGYGSCGRFESRSSCRSRKVERLEFQLQRVRQLPHTKGSSVKTLIDKMIKPLLYDKGSLAFIDEQKIKIVGQSWRLSPQLPYEANHDTVDCLVNLLKQENKPAGLKLCEPGKFPMISLLRGHLKSCGDLIKEISCAEKGTIEYLINAELICEQLNHILGGVVSKDRIVAPAKYYGKLFDRRGGEHSSTEGF